MALFNHANDRSTHNPRWIAPKSFPSDLARIAAALETHNQLLREVLEHNDYRFKEWMNRKFGKAGAQTDFVNPDDTEETHDTIPSR